MIVNFYYRKPNASHKSIELIFSRIAETIGSQITIVEKESPLSSIGFYSRLKMIAWAFRQRRTGDVHHVTGDIHFLVLGLPRRKTILTIHDLSFLKKGSLLSRFVLWLFWVYLPVWWVKQVTCVSDATKKDIVYYSFCNPDKVSVIPNFVKSEFKRHEKVFNKDNPVILQIGTTYNKNIERLANSLRSMTCHLRIIGRLSDSQILILQENKVSFSNAYDLKDDVLVDEYVKCDLLTFCSTMEGFGLPIVEAQAVGRVVVTSNVSSMPEIGGSGACYVNPFDTESITQGIRKVVSDDNYREGLIANGFSNVKRFNIEEISQKYLELYDEVC